MQRRARAACRSLASAHRAPILTSCGAPSERFLTQSWHDPRILMFGTADCSWENRPVRTLVFIPAWNEEASVAQVVGDVAASMPDVDVLVVDDGSIDATAARAR